MCFSVHVNQQDWENTKAMQRFKDAQENLVIGDLHFECGEGDPIGIVD